MVPRWSLVLGVKSALWDQRGPTPLSWGGDHAWSWDHDDGRPRPVLAPAHDGPARSDGAHGTGQGVGARQGHAATLTADRGR